jgi:hypothetical protein
LPALISLPELAEIQSLEEALHRPEIRRCREAVEALLAEGFVEFGGSGRMYDRAEIIDLLTQDDDGSSDLKATNYAMVSISHDAVLLTYETERSYHNGSKRRRVLRSSIWKHNGVKWQMLFHQGTIRP